MKNVIEIKNLKFGYQQLLFDHFNLNITSSFSTIIGSNGAGKSTLAKLLVGSIPYEGEIIFKIEGKEDIVLVTEFPTIKEFNTAKANMTYILKKLGYKKEEIASRIREISNTLQIEDLLDFSISHLSGSEQQLIHIACQIIKEPKILILDNATSLLPLLDKKKVFQYLKKLNHDNKLIIINITNDLEETIYGSQLILLHQGKVVLNKPTKKALLEEKIFKNCDLDLPFMGSLSLKLKYYGLVDSLFLDMNKMVNYIWK